MIHIIISIILALVFGCLFFIADFFEYKLIQWHSSFIAGFSIAYFFLVVLPEISKRLPEAPLQLEFFEYIFVLIGFVFVHVSEKLILQKVESGTQRKMRKLLEKEKILQSVEHNMEKILTNELKRDNLDESSLRDIARALSELNDKEEGMKGKINRYKIRIQDHINVDLKKFKFFTDYTYHFLIGIILVGLLIEELIMGILFFFYAFLRTIASKRSESHLIFTDLEIYEEIGYEEGSIIKYILGTSALAGILIGILLNAIFPENLELLFIFYSFISGVILYIIVREVIPEKEKGNPLKFILGLIGFGTVIVIINILRNVL